MSSVYGGSTVTHSSPIVATGLQWLLLLSFLSIVHSFFDGTRVFRSPGCTSDIMPRLRRLGLSGRRCGDPRIPPC